MISQMLSVFATEVLGRDLQASSGGAGKRVFTCGRIVGTLSRHALRFAKYRAHSTILNLKLPDREYLAPVPRKRFPSAPVNSAYFRAFEPPVGSQVQGKPRETATCGFGRSSLLGDLPMD